MDMNDIPDGPFLCPRYDEFRFIDDQGRERVQYCPVSGFSISGSCSRKERWYEGRCGSCQRLSGIRRGSKDSVPSDMQWLFLTPEGRGNTIG